jgi:hypothetical protein
MNTVTMCDNKLTVDDLMLFLYMAFFTLLPMAAPSKAWVSSRSLAKISVSKPAGGMDVSLL